MTRSKRKISHSTEDKLDEVHKRGYKIALLAAHQDSDNTDDKITMYRGDITLSTQLQLQHVFTHPHSEEKQRTGTDRISQSSDTKSLSSDNEHTKR